MENTPGTENPVCSNCHLPVQESDAFCAQCGQKRYRRKLNLRDYLEDISNFVFNWDNRLIRTFKALLFQPGELTRAYFAGEHQRYLSPVRVLLYSLLLAVPIMTFDIELNGMSHGKQFSSFRSALEAWQMKDSLENRLDYLQKTMPQDSVSAGTFKAVSNTVFPDKEDSLHITNYPVFIGDLLRKSPAELARLYIPEQEAEWKKRWIFKKEAERLVSIENPSQKVLSRVVYVAFIVLPIAGFLSWLLHGRKRFNYLENLVTQNFVFCFLLWMFLFAWVADLLPLSEQVSYVLNIIAYGLFIGYAFLSFKNYFAGPVWLHALRSVVMVVTLVALFLSSTLAVYIFSVYII